MFRQAGSVLSFLSILPTGNANLETVARNMHLFPLAGIVLGLIAGSVGIGLSIFLDSSVTSLVIVALIAVVTGLHHVDSLADFADGLMAKGSKERKLAVMKDPHVGSAGTTAIVLCMVGLIIAFSIPHGRDLFLAILIGEIVAKFSMVLLAAMSKSASTGSSSRFVDAMKNRKKLLFAGVTALVPVVVLGDVMGLIAFMAGMAVPVILLSLSARHFGGITGDVLGTANEAARLVSVMAFVAI